MTRLHRRRTATFLAGAALIGGLVSAVGGTTAQAAPSAFFCADETQPMATAAQVAAFTPKVYATGSNPGSPGTSVTGLTVVQGTTPSEFTGEYVGSIKDGIVQGVDMLLFQMSSPAIDGTNGLKAAGIWAGMSGSPVYTDDGELVGAVSYGLNADNLPIAGITPATYMKEIGTGTRDTAAPARVSVTTQNLRGASASLVGQKLRQIKAVKVAAGSSPAKNALANTMFARTPKGAKGSSALRGRDFQAAAAPTNIAAPLVAGGNIAVGYATGDGFAGGVGTVTAVCGDTVWAFGHPMDWYGATKLSMANASSAMIVPDGTGVVGSYKQVGSIGQPVGMITQDRLAGIRGTVGPVTGAPITVNVRNKAGRTVATLRSVAVNPLAAAGVASNLVGYAVLDRMDSAYGGVVSVSWSIDYKVGAKTGRVKNRQVYTDPESVAYAASTDIGDQVWTLGSTDTADSSVTGVTATVQLLSDDTINYKVTNGQVKLGKRWVSLKGRTLKGKGTYRFRPIYTKYVNGRPKGTSIGPSLAYPIGRHASGPGAVTFGSVAEKSGDDNCIDLGDGEIICFDFEEPTSTSFASVVKDLDALVRNDRAYGEVKYKWRTGHGKGSMKRTSKFTAPGVITGSFRASFRVRG